MKRLCIAILACAAGAVALMACGESNAPRTPPPSGTPAPAVVGPVLVYTETSQETVVAYDAGSSREIRRTPLPVEARAKALAKTGSVIYVAQLDDSFELRAIDPLSGDEQTVYTAPGFTEWSIAVSPDGTQVACAEIAAPANATSPPDTAVRILNLGAGSARTVATFDDPIAGTFRGRPVPRVWRDNGRGFLVSGDTSSGAPGGWATIMTDGTLTNDLQEFGWPAPNGRYLASEDLGLDCVNHNPQRLRIFSADANAVVAEVDDPMLGILMDDWSPDGESLTYRRFMRLGAADGCLSHYDQASAQRFMLRASGGDPIRVPDFDALRRTWYGDRLIDLRCADGSAPDAFGQCGGSMRRSILLNGQPIAAADDPRILGWIDAPAQVAATAAPGATVTPSSTTAPALANNCATSAAIQPPSANDAIVNADGDGIPDRLAVLAQPAPPGATVEPPVVPSAVATTTPFAAPTPPGTFELQLVLDGRTALNIEASPTTLVRAAPIGGYDVDGDGRDELFAATGNGAYTTWIDVFEFDSASCTLARITNPDPHAVPPLFAVGASVRNGVGLECVDHLLVATRFTSSSDEPLRYAGTRTSYRIVDTHIQQVAQTSVQFDADEAGRVGTTFSCGNLRLPR